jgi:transcription-repair coupling factor (superfamily II helicase)
MDGRQVALLVPTTVLAEQHYRTFSERLADYPVEVDVLSRFRTPIEQRAALEALTEGKIDIMIGTHRLLQKDVRFQDLGLVIIDEEQRFGVRHKERLKQMRTLVDCLTLTATPIPRTLYMSLNGVRDMSLVNTPPKDRQPIQTYVHDWSREAIESAILRELARGGQVYFVHNRVQSIAGVAALLGEIVPEARVVIGHGQMAEKELARVMRDFIDRRYDVLLSTTIIGSGLDIPSVNTIIIDRADTFGLADLYQLRGRVGRDRHRAYCYLLIPSRGTLSRVAKQRLLAIQEFNQLGSGFQLALRDMEIRGMGNLLGREQHGHIAALGFDLYSRLLTETVDRLTGKQRHTYPEPQVELAPGDAEGRGEINPRYVPSARLRMSLYKRLAGLRELAAVEEFDKEIADLYGTPPPETQRLVESQRMRILAWQAGIDLVRVGARQAQLRYCEEAAHHHFSPERVLELDRLVPGQLGVRIRNGVLLTLKPAPEKSPEGPTLLAQANILLEHIGKHARTGGGA